MNKTHSPSFFFRHAHLGKSPHPSDELRKPAQRQRKRIGDSQKIPLRRIPIDESLEEQQKPECKQSDRRRVRNSSRAIRTNHELSFPAHSEIGAAEKGAVGCERGASGDRGRRGFVHDGALDRLRRFGVSVAIAALGADGGGRGGGDVAACVAGTADGLSLTGHLLDSREFRQCVAMQGMIRSAGQACLGLPAAAKLPPASSASSSVVFCSIYSFKLTVVSEIIGGAPPGPRCSPDPRSASVSAEAVRWRACACVSS